MNEESVFGLLRLLETPGVGTARVSSLLRLAENDESKFAEILRDPERLRTVLSEKQMGAFYSLEERVWKIWKRLEEKGVRILSILEERYPSRLRVALGAKAPPLLLVLGNEKLLEQPAVGFCGSRKASEKGLATAADCADQLAREGVNVVSGYAAGVDMAGHRAALKAGGVTTIVLCEGILRFTVKRELRDLWDWDRVLVLSEFLPGVPWSVRNAMQRNRTICALSDAMILIESGATGGSMEAGKECLRMGIPLFTPVYEGMPEAAVGNQVLLKQGARPLLKSRKAKRANMRNVFSVLTTDQSHQAALQKPYPKGGNENGQLMLFEPSPHRYTGRRGDS